MNEALEKILEFKAMPDKCLYNTEDFKIYACKVNSMYYPDVKIGKYDTATLKGNIQQLEFGCEYLIKAKETKDKYGYSYEVINVRRDVPTSIESSQKFLREIITDREADILLKIYPDIVQRIMSEKIDDIDFDKLKGIKEKTFEKIKNRVIENFKLVEIVDEFSGVFSLNIMRRLYAEYSSIQKIRDSLHNKPYECLCKLGGIGFKTADDLLLRVDKISKERKLKNEKPILDFDYDLISSYQRMKTCAYYVLEQNEEQGNTYMSLKLFQKECLELCPEAGSWLPSVIKDSEEIYFNRDKIRISLSKTYNTEKFVADSIKKFLKNPIKWNIDIEKYRTVDGSVLTDDQMKTLDLICNNNLVLLQGYAGSGKSFSTKALINLLKDNWKSVALFAPTGRAAKVLSGYTNENAMTIHRGLRYISPREWGINSQNPITADIVIVDETSMADIDLMKHLFEAVMPEKTKMLFIGDNAQIPSVSCGNFFHDMLKSNVIPTVYLTKVFRYGIGGLSTVATDIRQSLNTFNQDNKLQVIGEDKGMTFISMEQSRAVDYIVLMYKKMIDNGVPIEDILVLASQNVGEYGTQKLNDSIQEVVNKSNECVKYGNTEYRLGDPIIQCVNDYKAFISIDGSYSETNYTFVSNGEIGIIKEILFDAVVADFNGNKIHIPKSKFQNIKLAYAISIHKSQGGQAKNIIVFAPKAHTFMLNSNLLYVAVTRAKEKCFLISDYYIYNKAIQKKENFDRKTWLYDLLKE